jgi:hypothetical protein
MISFNYIWVVIKYVFKTFTYSNFNLDLQNYETLRSVMWNFIGVQQIPPNEAKGARGFNLDPRTMSISEHNLVCEEKDFQWGWSI